MLHSKMKPDIRRYFSEDEIQIIKTEGAKAEKQGQWTSEMFSIAKEKRLYHLLVPEIYGGKELSLPVYLPLLEAASWLDGSFGWNLTLASGAGIFAAYMNPSFAIETFKNDKIFISGSGYPGGTAEKQNDGSFSVNGKWKYASGLSNADLITASCFVEEKGKSLIKNGKTVIKAVACYPDEIDVTGEWNSYGLKGTNTLDFEINDKIIPPRRVFEIKPNLAQVSGPLYQFPFDPFARCTLTAAFLGMGERFLHESKIILLNKHSVDNISGLPEKLQYHLESSVHRIKTIRKSLFDKVDEYWKTLPTEQKPNDELAENISGTATECASEVLQSVQAVYPLLGMKAVDPDSDINRFWRDIHTASQHMLLSPKTN